MSHDPEAVIANAVLPIKRRDGHVETVGVGMARVALDALAAAGYTVTKKDENHGPTDEGSTDGADRE